MPAAELVFVNGSVVTLDARGSVVSALAVADGRIVAVGDRLDVEGLIGSATRVIDLRGGTLLPGINDSHMHAINWGYNAPPFCLDVGFPAVRSIADVVEAVRVAAASKPAGEWIVGVGWDTGYLRECLEDPRRTPTRHDLDAVAPDNPVFLDDFSRHTAWANSLALERGGVTADTVAPAGATIHRDESGMPTGVLNEGARDRLEQHLPPVTNEERKAAIRSAVARLNALGITSTTEPGLGPGGEHGVLGEGGLQAYQELLEAGELNARTVILLWAAGLSSDFATFRAGLDGIHVPQTPDPRMLQTHGVKLYADGVPPLRTGWMHDEYLGDGGFGGLVVAGESAAERVLELERMVAYAHELGHQVGVHVTGDRGIDTVVEAFAKACRAHPRADPRHYVIHGDFVTKQALATCARYGFGINMNPTIKWTIADLEEEIVGPQRAAYEWPYRTALDAGVHVASGSDAPVTEPDWRQGVATMILRKSKATGRISGPDQRITLQEALRTYTTAGARQDFAETWKGTLEIGKAADLCALPTNLLTTDPHDIPTIPITTTVLNGTITHHTDPTD